MTSISNFFYLSNHYVQSTILRNKAHGRETDIKGCLQRYWSNPSCQGHHQIKRLRANPDPKQWALYGLIQKLDESLKNGDPHHLVDYVAQFVISQCAIKNSEKINQLHSAFKRKLVVFEDDEYPFATCKLINEMIDLDLNILLSKPLGLYLIVRVLSLMPAQAKLGISPSNEFLIHIQNETITKRSIINYNITQPYLHQKYREKIYLAESPTFISLAHELLHLIHEFEYDGDHLKNPSLDPKDTSEEEFRTIYNAPCCALHPTPDPCNEETLRKAFELDPRVFHHSTIVGPQEPTPSTPMEVDDKSPSSSKEEASST